MAAAVMPALSLLVPCLNEADSLPRFVERAWEALDRWSPAAAGQWEIVLVDDGSRDATWDRIDRLRRQYPGLRSVRHQRTAGIPTAWRTGVAHAGGESVCVIDADLQYDPAEIPRLWSALQAGDAEIVQGVRAPLGRRRDSRYLLSRGLCGLLNLLFGMSSRDNKSGFFMCRREVLRDLLSFQGRYRHWQCFVMVAAHHRGYRIRELETPFGARHAGRSAFGTIALGPAVGVALDLVTALREYPPVRR
jgi:phenylacetate-CoA ligase